MLSVDKEDLRNYFEDQFFKNISELMLFVEPKIIAFYTLYILSKLAIGKSALAIKLYDKLSADPS